MLKLKVNRALVKALREDSGLSRNYIARQSGIDTKTLRTTEAGTTAPTLDLVNRLAHFYKVRPSDLLIEQEE